MGPNVYEGTWEEVARHAAELAGRRVRLTVLDDLQAPVMLDRALTHLLEAADRLLREPVEPPDPMPSSPWGEGVVQKFRIQGFHL
jgi:hypothetical protein